MSKNVQKCAYVIYGCPLRLNNHIKTFHQDFPQYSADSCVEKDFVNLKTELKAYLEWQLRNNKYTTTDGSTGYKCPLCPHKTQIEWTFYGHFLRAHEYQAIELSKSFRCSLCQFEFAKQEDLKRHFTTVHEEQKPSSSTSQRMTKGQKRIRPVRCYVCKLDFSEYGEYKQHMISFHQFTKTSLENMFSNEEEAQKEKNTIKGQIISEGN